MNFRPGVIKEFALGSQLFCCFFVSSLFIEPKISKKPLNTTAALGRDAYFSCTVENLGGFKIAWIKVETKAILGIHNHVVSRNKRISLMKSSKQEWILKIANVHYEDRGGYMCQVNTNPMKYEVAFLTVTVSPQFLSNTTTGIVKVAENEDVFLACQAFGAPEPTITWRKGIDRRQILRGIQLREGLLLKNISRHESDTYFCIAENGVGDVKVNEIEMQVHYGPSVTVTIMKQSSRPEVDVTMECRVNSNPLSYVYWMDKHDNILEPSPKYNIWEKNSDNYASTLFLKIRNMKEEDFGPYFCVAHNSLKMVKRMFAIEAVNKPGKNESHLSYNHEEKSTFSMKSNNSATCDEVVFSDKDDDDIVTHLKMKTLHNFDRSKIDPECRLKNVASSSAADGTSPAYNAMIPAFAWSVLFK